MARASVDLRGGAAAINGWRRRPSPAASGQVSIVECGGKANMVFFARVCDAVGVPFVILHDRDANPGPRPPPAHRVLHEQFRALAGSQRTIELAPDFEAVARLRGSGHKPERAWRRFAQLNVGEMPSPLVRAVRLTLALAGAGDPVLSATTPRHAGS